MKKRRGSGFWSLSRRTGENITTIPHGNWVTTLAFSPDSRMLAIGGRDSKVAVHDTFTAEEIFSLPHEGWVTSLSFGEKYPRWVTPDKRRAGHGVMVLASAGKDDKVMRWPQVATIMAKRAVAFWAQYPSPMIAPRPAPLACDGAHRVSSIAMDETARYDLRCGWA